MLLNILLSLSEHFSSFVWSAYLPGVCTPFTNCYISYVFNQKHIMLFTQCGMIAEKDSFTVLRPVWKWLQTSHMTFRAVHFFKRNFLRKCCGRKWLNYLKKKKIVIKPWKSHKYILVCFVSVPFDYDPNAIGHNNFFKAWGF